MRINGSHDEGETKKSKTKDKFTAHEDIRLKCLVKEFGKDWYIVSSMLEGRTPRQCRERYTKYLSPNINTKPWSQEEDDQLLYQYSILGSKWRKISKVFNNRTDINIKNRCIKLLKQKEKSLNENANRVDTEPSNHSLIDFVFRNIDIIDEEVVFD